MDYIPNTVFITLSKWQKADTWIRWSIAYHISFPLGLFHRSSSRYVYSHYLKDILMFIQYLSTSKTNSSVCLCKKDDWLFIYVCAVKVQYDFALSHRMLPTFFDVKQQSILFVYNTLFRLWDILYNLIVESQVYNLELLTSLSTNIFICTYELLWVRLGKHLYLLFLQ